MKTDVLNLKPCPFCGSDLLLLEKADGIWFHIECACGSRGDSQQSKYDAARRWNRRSYEEEIEMLEKQIANLEEQLWNRSGRG